MKEDIHQMGTHAGVKSLQLGPNERDFGVTATIRHQETGELKTMHEPGSARVALRAVAHRVDDLGPAWKIAVLSNPASIFRDLQGPRQQVEKWVQPTRVDAGPGTDDPRKTEWQLLGYIGRHDLLEPLRRPVTEKETPGRDAAGHYVRPGWQRRIA